MNPSIKRRNKAKGAGLRQNSKKNNSNDHMIVLMKHIIPDFSIIPLKYYWSTVVLANSGFRTASHQFLVNGVFDIDASLGSTSAVGFNEYAALYSRYRALSVEITATFVNTDGVPTFCCICLGNTSFSTNGFNQSYWGDDYSRWKPLGQNTGSDATTLRLAASIPQIVGDPGCKNDMDYASLTSANPVKLVYCNIAIDSGSNSFTMTNGALVRYELTVHTKFFQRINLSV